MIKQNGSAEEMNSPYFVRNKEFCKKFEDFIFRHHGKVKGNYNAWSYSIIGKIKKPGPWVLHYKKATFTSGNLFLSTKNQNILTTAVWKSKPRFNFFFKIRKKTIMDYFNLKVLKSHSTISYINQYIIHHKNQDHCSINQVLEILKPLFLSNKIYQIENSNESFKIELRTEEHHFEIFKRIAKLYQNYQQEI